MGRRVVAALALGLVSCSFGPGEERLPGAGCSFQRVYLTVQRGGAEVEDINLWEIVIHGPKRDVRCWSARGGWLCDDPAFDGMDGDGLAIAGQGGPSARGNRGLPQVSMLHASLSSDTAYLDDWRIDVRRNGGLVLSGASPLCGTVSPKPCDAGLSTPRVLVIPEVGAP